MSSKEIGQDCCGDRAPCNSTDKCPCGCNLCYCRWCYGAHCIKLVENQFADIPYIPTTHIAIHNANQGKP